MGPDHSWRNTDLFQEVKKVYKIKITHTYYQLCTIKLKTEVTFLGFPKGERNVLAVPDTDAGGGGASHTKAEHLAHMQTRPVTAAQTLQKAKPNTLRAWPGPKQALTACTGAAKVSPGTSAGQALPPVPAITGRQRLKEATWSRWAVRSTVAGGVYLQGTVGVVWRWEKQWPLPLDPNLHVRLHNLRYLRQLPGHHRTQQQLFGYHCAHRA